MKWELCTLLAIVDTGDTDELGNAVMEYEEVKEVRARLSPWTNEEIQLDSRGITRNQQRFVIPIPIKELPKCDAIRLNGRELEIGEVIDLSPRYTAVLVKSYKE